MSLRVNPGPAVQRQVLPRVALHAAFEWREEDPGGLIRRTRLGDELEGDPPPVRRSPRVAHFRTTRRYALVIVSGKEPGKVFPIEKVRVTIGRTGCDVVLDDTKLSRQHALITIDGTSARLEDLGSTNGTFVGERRIERADLEDRSEFRVASHQLLFVVTDRNNAMADISVRP